MSKANQTYDRDTDFVHQTYSTLRYFLPHDGTVQEYAKQYSDFFQRNHRIAFIYNYELGRYSNEKKQLIDEVFGVVPRPSKKPFETNMEQLVLISDEGDLVEAPVSLADLSDTFSDMFEVTGDDHEPIYVPHDLSTLQTIAAFTRHYEKEPMRPIAFPIKSAHLKDAVQPWYVDLVADTPKEAFFALVKAAVHLQIQPLVDLLCLQLAILIKDLSATKLYDWAHSN